MPQAAKKLGEGLIAIPKKSLHHPTLTCFGEQPNCHPIVIFSFANHKKTIRAK
jgi:hypothetical protein